MTLAEVLAPISVAEFLRTYVGQQYALVRGAHGRFHRLLSWRDLDEALSRLRVNDDRVFLVRNGQRIPTEAYVQTSKTGRSQYLIGPSVAKHVAAGATLVVNQVDELLPPVRRLAESCEETFQIYVSANLYAGWRRDKGFDVHRDSHDTLIVQVTGQKDWKVWGPTRPRSIEGDPRDVRPSEEPIWQGTLQDGDTLYMPRGWWHVACPRDEPSLHVTIGMTHQTGIDLLNWMLQQMTESMTLRMDIPHWKTVEERREWIRAIREACVAALGDDVIEQYMASMGERAHTRPIIRLPETAAAVTAPAVGDLTPLRLLRGRRLQLHRNGMSKMSFKVQGVEWQCHEALAPALALLNHIEPCTLADMQRIIEDHAKPLLRSFVTALITADVIWAEPFSEPTDLEHVSP